MSGFPACFSVNLPLITYELEKNWCKNGAPEDKSQYFMKFRMRVKINKQTTTTQTCLSVPLKAVAGTWLFLGFFLASFEVEGHGGAVVN